MRTRTTYSQNGTNSLAYTGPRAKRLDFIGDSLEVALVDGRILRVPLDWYPRLERATEAQRQNYRWIGKGIGINWPDIDEHLSVEGLLKGNKAPRSKAYLTGKFSAELEAWREKIEAAHKKPSKLIPSKRATMSARRTAKSSR